MSENNKKHILLPECGYYLKTIYFYLTKGCNLKCRHCWINPKFQTEKTIYPSLDVELLKNIIKQGKKLGLLAVKLTGGEPLIHPNIVEILEYIHDEGLKLIVETNGIKCTLEIADKIVICKKPFISVSIDGADAKTHEWVRGVPGSFDAAIAGIRNLVNAGLRPQIIMSIMRHNADQLEEVVRLAEKEGASSVKFNLVTPTTERGENMDRGNHILSIKELLDLGFWVENILVPSAKIKVYYSHPDAFKPLNKLFKNPGGHCGILRIIGVLADGKYALCGIGESIPELVFGQAREDSLAGVWNNNEVLKELRIGLPEKLTGICGNCLMKKQCLASCIALNYNKYRNLFAPHWYCDEAYKIGHFPKTRMIGSVAKSSKKFKML